MRGSTLAYCSRSESRPWTTEHLHTSHQGFSGCATYGHQTTADSSVLLSPPSPLLTYHTPLESPAHPTNNPKHNHFFNRRGDFIQAKVKTNVKRKEEQNNHSHPVCTSRPGSFDLNPFKRFVRINTECKYESSGQTAFASILPARAMTFTDAAPMRAFVGLAPLSCCPTATVAPATCSSFTARVAPASRTRRARLSRHSITVKGCAESQESAEPVVEEAAASPSPPEPYPGFYADMRRAGLSDKDAQAQAAKAAGQAAPSEGRKLGGKKSLLGPDGKPLAPWMKVAEGSEQRSIRKRKGDSIGRLAGDPQAQELSGQGLEWKMLGDELELQWATGNEEGNRGFVVTRRKAKEAEWTPVSDWKDKPAELATKGPKGGVYSFVVPDAEPGAWVYRISDVDSNGAVSDLSQTLVDIESGEDSQTRLVALAALLLVIAGFVAFSIFADPLSGTS
jgi:hypothetical protein